MSQSTDQVSQSTDPSGPTDDTPFPGSRLRAVACLLAPAPLGWLLFRCDQRPLVAHWYRQALGLTLLLQLVWAAFTALFFILTALLYVPQTDRLLAYSNWVLPILSLVLAGAWLLLFAGAVVMAALGSARRIPWVAALGRTRRRRRVAWVTAAGGYLFAGVLLVVTLHATHLTRHRDGRPARVYVLYDHHAVNIGTTPRWVMVLGTYRVARAARQRWGADAVVVDRMSLASLREAFLHGEVVILATHGKHGRVHYDNDQRFEAHHLGHQVRRGPRLKLVYLTACGGGHAHDHWQRGLRPAQVISFARNSSTSEHAWWFWIRGPQLIHKL